VLQSQSVASCLAKEGNIANTPTSPEELCEALEQVASQVLPAIYTGRSDAVHSGGSRPARPVGEPGFR
jgi:hypothetical protein